MPGKDTDAEGMTPLLTIAQTAAICQVSIKTVRRWIERGELVAHRLGRQWRIARKDLEAFIKIRRCA